MFVDSSFGIKIWILAEPLPATVLPTQNPPQETIPAILTPQQLSSLKDFILHKEMATALFGQATLKAIDATEQQRAKLRQLFEDARKEEDHVWAEASQRALKLLTPRQHDLLHDKFEQEGWW
jgi:hypothetical protein